MAAGATACSLAWYLGVIHLCNSTNAMHRVDLKSATSSVLVSNQHHTATVHRQQTALQWFDPWSPLQDCQSVQACCRGQRSISGELTERRPGRLACRSHR